MNKRLSANLSTYYNKQLVEKATRYNELLNRFPWEHMSKAEEMKRYLQYRIDQIKHQLSHLWRCDCNDE